MEESRRLSILKKRRDIIRNVSGFKLIKVRREEETEEKMNGNG